MLLPLVFMSEGQLVSLKDLLCMDGNEVFCAVNHMPVQSLPCRVINVKSKNRMMSIEEEIRCISCDLTDGAMHHKKCWIDMERPLG